MSKKDQKIDAGYIFYPYVPVSKHVSEIKLEITSKKVAAKKRKLPSGWTLEISSDTNSEEQKVIIEEKRDYYYISNGSHFLYLENGVVCWCNHVSKAKEFKSEEELNSFALGINLLNYEIYWRTSPPETFICVEN